MLQKKMKIKQNKLDHNYQREFSEKTLVCKYDITCRHGSIAMCSKKILPLGIAPTTMPALRVVGPQ